MVDRGRKGVGRQNVDVHTNSFYLLKKNTNLCIVILDLGFAGSR